MIDIRLRVALIIVTAFSMVLVIGISKKAKMEIKDATNWLLISLCMLVTAVLPETVIVLASIVGISLASNAAFAVLIFLLLCIVFYLNIRISRVSIQNRDIVQKLALLEKELRDERLF